MARSGEGANPESTAGAVETQVRADLAALVTTHLMGEGLAAMAIRLAALLDSDLLPMAIPGVSRELRECLLELARMGVDDDDDLDAQLSRPAVPAAVRDAEKS